MYFKNSENLSNRTYDWADDFEEIDFTKNIGWDDNFKSNVFTRKIKIDKNTDNLVIKLSKFPLEFIPEKSSKRLKVFIEISHNSCIY